MSEKKELISVIIPVYNGERFLRKCLESVQNQTYNELEIIVVNDGSTDNTIRILEDISREDKRVKIINYEIRKGVSEARNTALDSFNGEYVVFVDCDDFVSNDYIETMYKEIDKYDVVCSGYNEIEKGIVKEFKFENKSYNNVDETYSLFLEYYTGSIAMQTVWGKMFRRDVVEKRRFQNITIGEDEIFIVDLIASNISIKATEYIGYNYNKYDESTLGETKLKSPKFVKNVLRAQYLNAIRMTGISPYCQEQSRNVYKKAVFDVGYLLKRWEHDKKTFIEDSKVVKEHIHLVESLCKLSVKEKVSLRMYCYCPRIMWIIM